MTWEYFFIFTTLPDGLLPATRNNAAQRSPARPKIGRLFSNQDFRIEFR